MSYLCQEDGIEYCSAGESVRATVVATVKVCFTVGGLSDFCDELDEKMVKERIEEEIGFDYELVDWDVTETEIEED